MTYPRDPLGSGQTELSDDDRSGLRPTYIATRADLFDAEQRNIVQALTRRSPTVDKLLDDKYLRDLHRAMFGNVWAWAGHYRQRETNIGIDPAQISVAVRTLVDDARAWAQNESYEPDELAVRFHHRLVWIHPFPNGNGRHGRVAADLLVAGLGRTAFGWGSALEVDTNQLRAGYLRALRRADDNDIAELMRFARS